MNEGRDLFVLKKEKEGSDVKPILAGDEGIIRIYISLNSCRRNWGLKMRYRNEAFEIVAINCS